MKKTLVCLFVLFVLLTASFTASANNGAFLESPGKTDGPIFIEGENENEDCTAIITVTPYSRRDELDEERRADLELAYSQIAGTTDLSTICSSIGDIASYLNIKTTDIGVSDLFDMSYYNCDNHEEHGPFRIVLSSDALDNFVALMHKTKNGWEIVENATIENNGKQIVFTINSFSPFAFAVKADSTEPSKPGDSSDIWMYAIIMFVSAVSITILAVKLKKKA